MSDTTHPAHHRDLPERPCEACGEPYAPRQKSTRFCSRPTCEARRKSAAYAARTAGHFSSLGAPISFAQEGEEE